MRVHAAHAGEAVDVAHEADLGHVHGRGVADARVHDLARARDIHEHLAVDRARVGRKLLGKLCRQKFPRQNAVVVERLHIGEQRLAQRIIGARAGAEVFIEIKTGPGLDHGVDIQRAKLAAQLQNIDRAGVDRQIDAKALAAAPGQQRGQQLHEVRQALGVAPVHKSPSTARSA